MAFDDDALDLSGLPEAQRMRATALRLAVQHAAVMRPRWSFEQAISEVLALAEAYLDELYGGREKRLATMPYREYLATPEWDERRRVAYRAACYRCQLCNAQNVELHAHHRSYEHRGRREEHADLITLCARCHKAAHDFIWQPPG
jgi:hypothetical protein